MEITYEKIKYKLCTQERTLWSADEKYLNLADKEIIEFSYNDIDKLYIGKGDCCRCGCEGEYLYPKHEADKFNAETNRNSCSKIPNSDKKIMDILHNRFIPLSAEKSKPKKDRILEDDFCVLSQAGYILEIDLIMSNDVQVATLYLNEKKFNNEK